jgi:hypothetical protein
MPGKYVARLSVAPASGAATILDQPFMLQRDPMVMLSDAELKTLYAFRLNVVKTQIALRERQAQLDTAQRIFAAAKRAADSSLGKLTPQLTTQLAAVQKELAEITREIGAANAGRGGGGGGAAGAARGAALAGGATGAGGAAATGRGGRGGRGSGRGAAPAVTPGAGAGATQSGGAVNGAASGTTPPTGRPPANGGAVSADQDQNPAAPQAPQTIQARLGTTTEMLNLNFNPSPGQKKTLQELPAELQTQGDRVSKLSTEQLPALVNALKAAGIDVKTP